MRRLKKLSKRPRTSGLLAGCLAAVALLATASAASAVTYRPTRTDDPVPNGCKPKDCSLREAVIAADADPAGFSIIVLRPGKRYVLTRAGAGEDAALTGDLDLTGGLTVVKTAGHSHGGVSPATIDGKGTDRIFDLLGPNPRQAVFLRLVTLRNGHARASAGDDGNGGAIRGGFVLLNRGRLIGNTADGSGGAIYSRSQISASGAIFKRNTAAGDGGAVDLVGTQTGESLSESLIMDNGRATHNSAGGNGGMVSVTQGAGMKLVRTYIAANRASGSGGAIFNEVGNGVGVDHSTIVGNRSGADGGGLFIGGAAGIQRSTISDNVARDAGGGIATRATGSGPQPGLQVENSTIAVNQAGTNGGGIAGLGGHSTARLAAVTVARNLASARSLGGAGGGLYQGPGDVFSPINTLVALNSLATGATGRDCLNAAAPFNSQGHNLIASVAGCTGFAAAGDLVGGPLQLGKLADNGGPTKTVALLRGSRAIDHADPAVLPPRLARVDQRGVRRGNKPDIGAYERRAKK